MKQHHFQISKNRSQLEEPTDDLKWYVITTVYHIQVMYIYTVYMILYIIFVATFWHLTSFLPQKKNITLRQLHMNLLRDESKTIQVEVWDGTMGPWGRVSEVSDDSVIFPCWKTLGAHSPVLQESLSWWKYLISLSFSLKLTAKAPENGWLED